MQTSQDQRRRSNSSHDNGVATTALRKTVKVSAAVPVEHRVMEQRVPKMRELQRDRVPKA